jgi:hypothetical protein
VPHLPATKLRDFIVSDFEKAWNAMALAHFDHDVGGNFMFARQGMVLLELASRIATNDDALLEAFSHELARIDRLYFTPMPGVPRRRRTPNFRLPHLVANGRPETQLLAVVFDLVRNGQMHYGQQIPVQLSDGAYLGVALGGVKPGHTVDRLRLRPGERPVDHLAFRKRAAGHYELWLSAGNLFVDVQDAADRAGVYDGTASFEPFDRTWDATGDDIAQAIAGTGHIVFTEEGRLEAAVHRPKGQ